MTTWRYQRHGKPCLTHSLGEGQGTGKLCPAHSLGEGQGTGKLCPMHSLREGQGTGKLCPTYSLEEGTRRRGPGSRGPTRASECNMRGEAPKGRQKVA